MNAKLKLLLFTIASLVLIMIITNPSYNKFKEYANESKGPLKQIAYRRTSNYLFFSIYEKQVNTAINKYAYERNSFKATTTRYVGIFMNFYPSP